MPQHEPTLYLAPHTIEYINLLCDSFQHWTDRCLIEPAATTYETAQRLHGAPAVVVSHGTEADPVLNYGNRAALALWEMEWERFTATPSRETAESVRREERQRLLAMVEQHGYVEDYRGIRISASGRRFQIEHAMIWNVIDSQGHYHGQAATFSQWHYL